MRFYCANSLVVLRICSVAHLRGNTEPGLERYGIKAGFKSSKDFPQSEDKDYTILYHIIENYVKIDTSTVIGSYTVFQNRCVQRIKVVHHQLPGIGCKYKYAGLLANISSRFKAIFQG